MFMMGLIVAREWKYASRGWSVQCCAYIQLNGKLGKFHGKKGLFVECRLRQGEGRIYSFSLCSRRRIRDRHVHYAFIGFSSPRHGFRLFLEMSGVIEGWIWMFCQIVSFFTSSLQWNSFLQFKIKCKGVNLFNWQIFQTAPNTEVRVLDFFCQFHFESAVNLKNHKIRFIEISRSISMKCLQMCIFVVE